MHIRNLQHSAGQTVRIRPVARRKLHDARELPPLDDMWEIAYSLRKGMIQLRNSATGHFVDLGTDNVHEYRSSGHLMLKCQVTLRPLGLDLDPLPDPRALRGDGCSGSSPATALRERPTTGGVTATEMHSPEYCR
jgi:hypothetical protein